MSYQIVTDATSDLTPDLLAGLPPLAVVPMPVNIDGEPHSFGPGGDLAADSFYGILRNGSFGSTSMINPVTYMEVFEPILLLLRPFWHLSRGVVMHGRAAGKISPTQAVLCGYPIRFHWGRPADLGRTASTAGRYSLGWPGRMGRKPSSASLPSLYGGYL